MSNQRSRPKREPLHDPATRAVDPGPETTINVGISIGPITRLALRFSAATTVWRD